MLPNLIVIGAGKSGTTSLHHYLDQHPEISMSTPKELDYFQRKLWLEQRDWYESRFTDPTPVRGETSTGYSAYPVFKDVPRRIEATIPDVKLIYLVRDPIDRIVAHYAQHRANEKERRPFDEAMRSALRDGDDPVNPYLCMSSYATQVEQYLEVFPSERILVIDNVEMKDDRRAMLRKTFRFLGVDESFDSPKFDEVLNTQQQVVRFGGVGSRLRESRVGAAARSLAPKSVTDRARHLFSESVERPELSPELRRQLVDVLAPEVERLRKLTGKHFAAWSV